MRVGGSNRRGDAAIATDDARINDRIRARQVRLIGADGAQFGVKSLPEALTIAREQGLDLVEVAANADPPVCKIMDFGKYKYEQDQRRKESRRKASSVSIKEMKFRPKIDGHDYETKMKHVERFLEEGSKVKLTIMFRGREMAHPELGRRILEKVAERVDGSGHSGSGSQAGRPQHDDGAEPDAQAEAEEHARRGSEGRRRAERTGGDNGDRGNADRTNNCGTDRVGNSRDNGGGNAGRGARRCGARGRGRRSKRLSPDRTTQRSKPTNQELTMPKMKTHRGAAKRFDITGTGKIRRRKAFRSHLLETKSSRRMRRLGRLAELEGGDRKHVQRLLGKYGK